jgi:hypothetical protein
VSRVFIYVDDSDAVMSGSSVLSSWYKGLFVALALLILIRHNEQMGH